MSEYYKEDDIESELNLDSEEATQFHYFKLHDYDNNNKLDGLELFSAIAHLAQHEGGSPEHMAMDEEQVTHLVDAVLDQDDLNDDGFVDYYEFIQAQRQSKESDDSNAV